MAFFKIPYLFKSQSYKKNCPYFGSRYRVVQLALLLFFSAEKRDNLVNIKSCKQVRFQSNFSPFLCTLHQSGSVYLLPVLLYLKNPPSYLSQSDCKPLRQIGGRFASLQRKLLAVSLICDLWKTGYCAKWPKHFQYRNSFLFLKLRLIYLAIILQLLLLLHVVHFIVQ